MSIRLRAHHLLCILTFVGKGYTPAFTENYRKIAARLSAGEDIHIVSGPDDICAPLLIHQGPHCLAPGPNVRDKAAAIAVGKLLGAAITDGARITLSGKHLLELRKAFANSAIRAACSGCEWSDLCSAVASNGFERTLVHRS